MISESLRKLASVPTSSSLSCFLSNTTRSLSTSSFLSSSSFSSYSSISSTFFLRNSQLRRETPLGLPLFQSRSFSSVAVVESKRDQVNNILGSAASPLFQPVAMKEIEQVLGKHHVPSTQEDYTLWAEARRENVRISLKKLTQIAKTIRGLNYTEAVGQLTFMRVKVAPILLELIKQAKSNGEHLYGWDPSRMIVDLQIGKGKTGQPMVDIRGRGRSGVRRTSFSHIRARVRVVPPVERERRVGKFGLTHASIPKKTLSIWEVDELVKKHQLRKEEDRQQRIEKQKERLAQAKLDREKRDIERANAPEEEDIIEAMIPIRKKLTIRDLNPHPPHIPNALQILKDDLSNEMDQVYLKQLETFLEPRKGEPNTTVSVENLKELLRQKEEAKIRIARTRQEAQEELERKKKSREEALASQKLLEQQTQEKKMIAKEKREQKKLQEEEEQKRLQALLQQQREASKKK